MIARPGLRAAKTRDSMAKIILAEDDEDMRRFLVRALERAGHAVISFGEGASAFEEIKQGSFDLLLTDIKMPVMDGIALALSAARDFPQLKILLMTGYADQRERASGLDAIVHDVVTKPFSIADIRTAVADALSA